MTSWAVIVRRGSHTNLTLASIYFDRWGTKTHQSVITADDWQQGADTALQQGYLSALFVDAGTVFTDWPSWKNLIENYPHRGMIAHIIMHPGKNISIDPQCWFMDLDIKFNDVDQVKYPVPMRSDTNLHDDYTPLWVKPGDEIIGHGVDGFGQSLIAQQLGRGKSIVNWTPVARDFKQFVYGKSGLDFFQDYINLAENQFWIFNNEPVEIAHKEKIVCPGSGLFWLFNILCNTTRHIDIVDISTVQVTFCQDIWQHWDGVDYGSFVIDFMVRNNITHYELDRPDLDRMERLMLKNQARLRHYINARFQYFLDQMGFDRHEFRSQWQRCKSSKSMTAQKANLVDWIISNPITVKQDHVWVSNILDYKWTLLHTTEDKIQQFQGLLG